MSSLFVFVYGIWLLSEILLNRLLHSGKSDKRNADKNSLSLIWITIIAAISIATYISMRYYLPISANPVIKYAGIAIIITGMILRFAAVRSLGKFFTVDVTIRKDHQLKKDGLYKYLRHPSYSASLISFIGYGISLNNWLSLLLITILIIAAFIVRINVEEKALTEQFGAEYAAYKARTKALIPFIY